MTIQKQQQIINQFRKDKMMQQQYKGSGKIVVSDPGGEITIYRNEVLDGLLG